MEREILSVDELAEFLGVNRKTVLGEEPGIAIVRVYLEVGYEDVEVPIECMEPSAPGTVG